MSDPTHTQQPAAPGSDAESHAPDATLPRAPGAPVPALAFGPPAHEGEVGTLGRYRVLKQLGAGGMGAVYLGYHTGLQCKVALKVMLADAAASAAARERFLREARTAAQVKSDHVVTIHDVDEANGVPFIAMEYLLGAPLDQYLKKKGELPLEQAVRIVRECALGLAAVHAQGLIHRDIKPGNVWLEAPHGRAKLLDFGLARAEAEAGELTGTGGVVGTLKYMSPQQGRGLPVDARTDLWSLGVMLYRLCTGHMPFEGDSQMAVLTSIAIDAPTAPRALNPQVPPALDAIVLKLLAKDPAARFQTATELADALQRLTQNDVPQVVAVPLPQPQSLAVSAQTQNVWESIADDSQSVAVPLTEQTEATAAPRAEPARRASKLPLLLGAGVLVAALSGLVAVVVSVQNKPDVAKKDDDPPANVPPKKLPVVPNPNGKTPNPQPDSPEGKVYPLPPDLIAPMTPLKPEKVFTLDHLDPTNEKYIPKEERYDWQPKELVAVLGSHRQRFPGGTTLSLAVSPDGAVVLANGYAIDVATRKMLDRPPLSAFSPDGKRGAAANKVWEVTDLKKPPTEYPIPEHIIAFITNDIGLTSNGLGEYCAWKLDPKEPRPLEKFGRAGGFAVSNDRKYLAVASVDAACHVFAITADGLQKKFVLPGEEGQVRIAGGVHSLSCSDEGLLAICSPDNVVRVWDVAGPKPELKHVLDEKDGWSTVCLVPKENCLVRANAQRFQIWSLMGAKPSKLADSPEYGLIGSHGGPVVSTPDGQTIITGHGNSSVRFWGIEKGAIFERNPIRAQPMVHPFADLSPDGRFAALYHEDLHSHVWDLTELKPRVLSWTRENPARFSPDGTTLCAYRYVAGGNGLRVIPADQLGAAPVDFGTGFFPVCYSPDGKLLAASSGVELAIWDVSQSPPKRIGELVRTVSAPQWRFTPDGRFLVGRPNEQSGLWQVWAMTANGPKLRHEIMIPGFDCTSSPDGKTVVSCFHDGTRFYDLKDGVLTLRKKEPDHHLNWADFSPNGAALLVCTLPGVRVLDAATHQEIHHIRLRDKPLAGCWHPDGKHIFVTNADRTTYVLRLPKDVLDKIDDPDRMAMAYVFSVGGALSVTVGGEERSAKRFAEMPAGALPYRVSLEYQKNVSPEAIAIFRDCRRLVGFNAHSTDITDAALAHVAVHAGPKHLDLHVCPNVTDAALAHFKNHKQIEHLNLAAAKNVTDAGLAHFAGCTNLTFLDVHGTKVTPAKLAEFAKAVPNCKIVHDGGVIEPKPAGKAGADDREAAKYILSVGGRVAVRHGPRGVTSVVTKLGELPDGSLAIVYLELNELSDEGVAQVTGLRALTDISVVGSWFTDAVAARFDCPNLEVLNCPRGTKLGDRGLAALAAGKNLRRVIIDSPLVGDDGLKALAACPELGDVTLSKSAVTDAGLVHLKPLTELRSLSLDDAAITDEGLKHLEGLRSLRRLYLRNTKVTEPALKALKLKLHPACQIHWGKGTVKP